MVRVRILEHSRNICVVEYNNVEYTVFTADLTNVNAGWTYGWISESKLVQV